jgi:hypothetical protein
VHRITTWTDPPAGHPHTRPPPWHAGNAGWGHKIEIRRLGPQKVGVDLIVFPARGSRTVSRDMIRFFMLSYESTCQEIAADGNTVVRGTPVIPEAEGL